jgi:hypothetical protein
MRGIIKPFIGLSAGIYAALFCPNLPLWAQNSQNAPQPLLPQLRPDTNHLTGRHGFTLLPPLLQRLPDHPERWRLARFAAPYWRLGQYDAPLTRLCRTGYFQEQWAGRWFVEFTGTPPTKTQERQGPGLLGVALLGRNLHDPMRQAEAGAVYLFWNSGDTRCKVYVWRGPGEFSPQP